MSVARSDPRATRADLERTDAKAELMGGETIQFLPSGQRPNEIAGEIFVSLRQHARASGRAKAFTDNMGFTVPELSSGRESFSPDAAYYEGPMPDDDMGFIAGPPTCAVEVRSKSDYGEAAEAAMASKRADYFEAGTLTVWDVDPRARCVRCFQLGHLDRPTTFLEGQIADAGPAVPGWWMAVKDVFA